MSFRSLVGSRVVTADGTTLGKVAEVRATRRFPHRVTELDVGPAGWLERLNVAAVFGGGSRRQPHRVAWDAVDRVEDGTVVLKPGRTAEVAPSGA
jgi:sporulation protein YlmC with PRC-barrel domain